MNALQITLLLLFAVFPLLYGAASGFFQWREKT